MSVSVARQELLLTYRGPRTNGYSGLIAVEKHMRPWAKSSLLLSNSWGTFRFVHACSHARFFLGDCLPNFVRDLPFPAWRARCIYSNVSRTTWCRRPHCPPIFTEYSRSRRGGTLHIFWSAYAVEMVYSACGTIAHRFPKSRIGGRGSCNLTMPRRSRCKSHDSQHMKACNIVALLESRVSFNSLIYLLLWSYLTPPPAEKPKFIVTYRGSRVRKNMRRFMIWWKYLGCKNSLE